MGYLLRESSLKNSCCLMLLLLSTMVRAQYAASAGEVGTTAIHKDSSAIISWAISCDVQLGLQDISNSTLGDASVGSGESVVGIATGLTVVSLGDGGSAVVQFSSPIINGAGPDFAVFENSFDGDFLELAFVEVSSDGINYFRFPASSLTQTSIQVGSFGTLEATKINNLAGKYASKYGTPFDLEELVDEPALDVNAITHVKIIDVIGTIDTQYASYDTSGNIINDPWPTEFASSGFDLDGVGVINSSSTDVVQVTGVKEVLLYPNPVLDHFSIKLEERIEQVKIFNLFGVLVLKSSIGLNISTSTLSPGIYFVEVVTLNNSYGQKITVVNE
ncbi:MAG: hypothetical protein ACJA0Q_000632 [Saprospiraceae bacterium]|jgi:hypothetical protein